MIVFEDRARSNTVALPRAKVAAGNARSFAGR